MKRRTPPKPDDIVSEKYMCELFQMDTKQFRVLAKKEGFSVSKWSAKTRLYDKRDVADLFVKYRIE